ncbi:hypothetical protein [Glutamicibacter uratoxydans]|nr:hypothetical protein [Glutamicibacter uratoxydans]
MAETSGLKTGRVLKNQYEIAAAANAAEPQNVTEMNSFLCVIIINNLIH